MKNNNSEKHLFAVMELQKTVECPLFNGHKEDVEVLGVYGFIPVFETYNEAVAASSGGKHSIIEIKI